MLGRSAAVEAHAVVLESTPAAGATVAGPDVAIALRFNGRIDAARSRVALAGPDGKVRGVPAERPAGVDRLAARATGLVPGAYRIEWQVLAADGHVTRGVIPFIVTAAPRP
ncbi:MAG: copper resistance protein CopC [Alphaproteobacteria bacterium]|nr:copper resistance protein CopC [Alphaproteobacteria bacterium]